MKVGPLEIEIVEVRWDRKITVDVPNNSMGVDMRAYWITPKAGAEFDYSSAGEIQLKDFLVLGEAALWRLALIYISSNCAFLCFSFSPLGIFARNHFLIMFMNYPEPQGRRGAAGERPNREWLAAFFICQILTFL